jgi:membrane fusion protein (multidrug efflux system)
MNDMADASADIATENSAPPKNVARRKALIIFTAILVVAGLGWLFYDIVIGSKYVSTDNAYVNGDVAMVTSREAGTLIAVHADNAEAVRAGDLLVEFDPATADIMMETAKADLARTVRDVQVALARAGQLSAVIDQRRLQLSAARGDVGRRAKAAATGAVSAEEMAHSRDALADNRAGLIVAQRDLDQTLAKIGTTPVAQNPDVLAAAARVREAAVRLGHMRIVAPVDGVVAQRRIQPGQYVQAGAPLMAIVPLTRIWIDANFKETQLAKLRVGQPVKLHTSLYGGDVTYHGHVVGVGGGSGSAFALLPAENASGNWIKVVQRVPVRIALDPQEIGKYPLRIGVSAEVTVDVHDVSGPPLTSPLRPAARPLSDNARDPALEATIARIIAENSGRARR